MKIKIVLLSFTLLFVLNSYSSNASETFYRYQMNFQDSRKNDFISLNEYLEIIKKESEALKKVKELVLALPEEVRKKIDLSPQKVDDIVNQIPHALVVDNQFALSMVKAVNFANQKGMINLSSNEDNSNESKSSVPSNFDLSDFEQLSKKIEIPETEIDLVEDGKLWKGYIVDSEGDLLSKKKNIIAADLLQELSENYTKEDNLQKTLICNDKKIKYPEEFIQCLKDTGHSISITSNVRIADFLGLLHKDKDGNYLSIATPFFTKTDFKDEKGNPLYIPAYHSEIVISISSPKDNLNQNKVRFDGTVNWFPGTDALKFSPDSLSKKYPWAANRNRAIASGDKAWEALQAITLNTALFKKKAKDEQLLSDGYAINGVCNNGAAFVESFVTQKLGNAYPVVWDKDGAIDYFIKNYDNIHSKNVENIFNKITDTLKIMPQDLSPNREKEIERIINAFPWEDGNSPFPYLNQVHARFLELQKTL
jgi:hypothetical protein